MTKKASSLIAPLIKADEIMSSPLVFLRNSDTMRHAAALFLDKKFSGAPVLNHLNEPVGVLSKTDIVRYEREHVSTAVDAVRTKETMRAQGTLETVAEGSGYHHESEEDYVNHWMTPAVYTLSTEASLPDILREMSQRKVHRLFIREKASKKLIGVITTFDILRFLGRVFFVDGQKAPRNAVRVIGKTRSLASAGW
ncbi:MAG: CBS domain-containing protein [Elusimicrobia bacterium]|nr:CBS domain-containing protein [Elusimicrobiota bacterium]